MLYGKMSYKLNLVKTMLLCDIFAAVCYLLASLSNYAALGLIGCALCGLAVGIMWPGTISLSSRKCPTGGTAMFAFLALAGDLGATVGPVTVGKVAELTGENEALRNQFLEEGITIPQNLIVVGTVNMDETTFSFSRKVLDRAMTIEMNEVDLYAGLQNKYERIGKLTGDMLIGTAVEGVDVYADNEEVCNKVLTYLQAVNDVLDRTPFKIAYRTRNEFLLYVVNNLPYTPDENGNEFSENETIAIALDEITSMKILSRIEGDDTKVKSSLLKGLIDTIEEQLLALTGEEKKIESVSIAKLKEMQERLSSGYTSFWS
jgi:hypothetical protein